MLTIAELERMSQITLEEADRAKLVNIQSINLDPSQSAEQRMNSYLEQIRNPYVFMCGDTAMRIRFQPEEQALMNKLKNYLISHKTSS